MYLFWYLVRISLNLEIFEDKSIIIFTLLKSSHPDICKSVHSGFLVCPTVLFYNFLHKSLAYSL